MSNKELAFGKAKKNQGYAAGIEFFDKAVQSVKSKKEDQDPAVKMARDWADQFEKVCAKRNIDLMNTDKRYEDIMVLALLKIKIEILQGQKKIRELKKRISEAKNDYKILNPNHRY